MTGRTRPRLFCAVAALGLVVALASTGLASRTFEVVPLNAKVAGHELRGACIRYLDLKMNLQGAARAIPVLTLYSKGPYDTIAARAHDVAQQLELAMDLMDQGGWLTLRSDSLGHPGVWAASLNDKYSRGLRVLTVYPEDAKLMPGMNGDPHALAAYAKSLFNAHYALFIKHSVTPEDYEQIIKGEGGSACAVFKQIDDEFAKILDREGIKMEKGAAVSVDDRRKLRPALEQTLKVITDEQRVALSLLAFLPPVGWTPPARTGEAKGGTE